jgi:nucleolar protein 14
MKSKDFKTPGKNASALKKLKAMVLTTKTQLARVEKKTKKGRLHKQSLPKDNLKSLLNLPQNPFEVRLSHTKYDVLNRNLRGVKGKPELSRARALELRQSKLLPELERSKKANVFRDKRFGENQPNISLEEKMLERFSRERQRASRHSSLFNLEEEEDSFDEFEGLTHHQKPISEINHLDTINMTDDEDDDDEGWKLDAKGVKELHFGGFRDKKEALSEDNEEETTHTKSKKDIMDEIIAKSKLHRMERQKQRMETEELTQQLNQDFGALRQLLFGASGDIREATQKRRSEVGLNLKMIEKKMNECTRSFI